MKGQELTLAVALVEGNENREGKKETLEKVILIIMETRLVQENPQKTGISLTSNSVATAN